MKIHPSALEPGHVYQLDLVANVETTSCPCVVDFVDLLSGLGSIGFTSTSEGAEFQQIALELENGRFSFLIWDAEFSSATDQGISELQAAGIITGHQAILERRRISEAVQEIKTPGRPGRPRKHASDADRRSAWASARKPASTIARRSKSGLWRLPAMSAENIPRAAEVLGSTPADIDQVDASCD
jgi:hypothetical protein